jgi:sugar/nucleoside kinase (ribokinase family)
VVLGVAGDLLEDVVVHLAEPTRPGADATTARIIRRRGGSGANTAAAAAALGAPVRLVTAVGDDPLGRHLVDGLVAAGVEVAPR